jgi:putative endonuclease
MFYVYLLASKPRRTLYIGSRSDLVRRVWEHKLKAIPGFTAKYGVDRLVRFEQHDSLEAGMTRERQIKGWKRSWKLQLIEQDNPYWMDLYPVYAAEKTTTNSCRWHCRSRRSPGTAVVLSQGRHAARGHLPISPQRVSLNPSASQ